MAWLQSLLQSLFLRVEGLFDAAFGERLNPLYHLGAITFFLFWIAGGTGLYLYAFFETGVAAAYASVEAITHGQWFAGGVLRSLHRYASDALVLTMLLHLARHFAFDRFRGYRWFSWVTGVLLVWLVYASGINGYMLPWDRLAQFTIVTVFEWLDWLPIFRGTLMRNFTYAASVSDRFFSLLSFLHIGLPLALLLLMWVHVQRVPKARTMPPKPIAWGLGAALVGLSLMQPAISQGGAADLGQEVSRVALDWFYLALLPLVGTWPPGWVWALAVGGSLLLVVLPWLPGRRALTGEHEVTVHGAGGTQAQMRVRAGETLLDAGLRAGLALPYECRNGACGVCLCTVAQGRVAHRPHQPGALPPQARAAGQALMCCAEAVDDMGIEVDVPLQGGTAEPGVHTGRIDAMELLAPDVMRLWVALPPGERIHFGAGQYINIVLEDGQRRAFSFANAPHDAERIELHVRRIPGGRFTSHVFEVMRPGDPLRFEGPLGSFTLREGDKPILLVAAATGFAPVKSIVEDALHRGVRRPIHLYWGVRRPHDLYMLDLPERWRQADPTFRFVPVVSEPAPGDNWQGRTGLVHAALLEDFADLAGHEVYVCGSVRMVDAAVRDFLARGLDERACFSDAFLPAAPAP
jgi:CDP-4-dehydro-6-deoxyglucose reductase, E3